MLTCQTTNFAPKKKQHETNYFQQRLFFTFTHFTRRLLLLCSTAPFFFSHTFGKCNWTHSVSVQFPFQFAFWKTTKSIFIQSKGFNSFRLHFFISFAFSTYFIPIRHQNILEMYIYLKNVYFWHYAKLSVFGSRNLATTDFAPLPLCTYGHSVRRRLRHGHSTFLTSMLFWYSLIFFALVYTMYIMEIQVLLCVLYYEINCCLYMMLFSNLLFSAL